MKNNISSFAIKIIFTLAISLQHLQAQVWTKSNPTANSIWDVWGTDAQNVWVSGNSGTIFKWNGTVWTNQSVAALTGQRYGLWGASNTNIYSVGGTTGQQIAQFNGSSWSIVTSAVTVWGSGIARSVWGSSASDVWITGGSGRVMRYNGSGWAMQSTGLNGTFSGNTIWGLNASNIWAVGSTGGNLTGTIYKWNPGNSSWSAQASSLNVVRSIWGASANDVWAVGGDAAVTGGRIYRFNGTAWSDVTPAGGVPMLFSIWGQDNANIWACGENGSILYWNGTTWTTQTSATTSRLYSIFGAGSSGSLWITAEAAADNVLRSSQPVTPLPLQLLSFTAKAVENQLVLRWSTVQEMDTDKIEVEIAGNDLQFRTQTVIPTKGNGKPEQQHYHYEFSDAESGKTYHFRLKMIDRDGSYTHSRIEVASLPLRGDGSYVYPNPAQETIRLSSDLLRDVSRIEIVDLMGHSVLTAKVALQEPVVIKQLNPGTYTLKLYRKDGSYTSQRLMIKK